MFKMSFFCLQASPEALGPLGNSIVDNPLIHRPGERGVRGYAALGPGFAVGARGRPNFETKFKLLAISKTVLIFFNFGVNT